MKLNDLKHDFELELPALIGESYCSLRQATLHRAFLIHFPASMLCTGLTTACFILEIRAAPALSVQKRFGPVRNRSVLKRPSSVRMTVRRTHRLTSCVTPFLALQFQTALECIAESKGVSVGDVEGLVTAAKGPASSGTVAEAVKFHDDKALYTVRTGSTFLTQSLQSLPTVEVVSNTVVPFKFHDDKALYTVRRRSQTLFDKEPRIAANVGIVLHWETERHSVSVHRCLVAAQLQRLALTIERLVENAYRVRNRTVSDLEGGCLF
jgi:hypothetical protein